MERKTITGRREPEPAPPWVHPQDPPARPRKSLHFIESAGDLTKLEKRRIDANPALAEDPYLKGIRVHKGNVDTTDVEFNAEGTTTGRTWGPCDLLRAAYAVIDGIPSERVADAESITAEDEEESGDGFPWKALPEHWLAYCGAFGLDAMHWDMDYPVAMQSADPVNPYVGKNALSQALDITVDEAQELFAPPGAALWDEDLADVCPMTDVKTLFLFRVLRVLQERGVHPFE